MIPPRQMLRMCRRTMRLPKVADSTGMRLTGAGLLSRALIFRRILRRILAEDERHVGLLVPPSVGGLLANAATTLDARIAVNLNYTVSSEVMNYSIAKADIRHVLASRRLLERFPLDIGATVVHVEDLRSQVTAADKAVALLQTWFMPVRVLERRLGLTRLAASDLMTIIFTSGSTGRPKGVMLSYDNVGSNVAAFADVLKIARDDTLVGLLPYFHSFGYTTTLWSALTLDAQGVYHYTPLEPKPIGKLCREHRATILVGTPTFLRSYVRRCEPEEFASLEVVITGAEKLPRELADSFEQRFGIRPLEGYGATELSPVVSANIPPRRATPGSGRGAKEGTVGQPMPGVEVKVVDPDSGQPLGSGRSGMLLVRGHNVMMGYLDEPERTAEVIRDGWYVTGDIAEVDADGYIRITGRQSRFSKIGGEMVPHIRVEEVIAKLLRWEDEEEVKGMVTSVPDPKKGERLVVLHTGLSRPAEEICREMAREGLPAIWIPSPDSFVQVDAIPLLGTGKLDFKAAHDLAASRLAEPVPSGPAADGKPAAPSSVS